MTKKQKSLTAVTTQDDATKSSIWGGRFSSGPSQLMKDINESISFDRRLYRQDIAGSKAHASMLATCKIISHSDCTAIHKGLDQITSEIEADSFVFSKELEDIHMNNQKNVLSHIHISHREHHLENLL